MAADYVTFGCGKGFSVELSWTGGRDGETDTLVLTGADARTFMDEINMACDEDEEQEVIDAYCPFSWI